MIISTPCCFSGHRKIESRHIKRLPSLLRETVASLYEQGVREFRAGGAVGFDILAELSVIEFRADHPDVRLVLYIPCPEQDSKWNDNDRRAYRYALSAADEVIVVSESYFPGCMMKRNRSMAEGCGVCVAYQIKETGGTAATVRFAASNGAGIINLGKEI